MKWNKTEVHIIRSSHTIVTWVVWTNRSLADVLWTKTDILGLSQQQRERESILLHKDKDLSTSQLFNKSVPDGKHSNTQYVKQDYDIYIYIERERVSLCGAF